MTTLTTMYAAQTNSPTTSLTGVLGNSDTTVNVADATVFSGLTPPFEMTIGISAVQAETVIVTAVNGNMLTVTRGWDGAAVSWPIGTLCARTLSARDINDIQGNIGALNSGKAETSHTQAAGTITAGMFAGKVEANATAAATLGDAQMRNISAGSTDLTPGTSALTTGNIYLYYA